MPSVCQAHESGNSCSLHNDPLAPSSFSTSAPLFSCCSPPFLLTFHGHHCSYHSLRTSQELDTLPGPAMHDFIQSLCQTLLGPVIVLLILLAANRIAARARKESMACVCDMRLKSSRPGPCENCGSLDKLVNSLSVCFLTCKLEPKRMTASSQCAAVVGLPNPHLPHP